MLAGREAAAHQIHEGGGRPVPVVAGPGRFCGSPARGGPAPPRRPHQSGELLDPIGRVRVEVARRAAAGLRNRSEARGDHRSSPSEAVEYRDAPALAAAWEDQRGGPGVEIGQVTVVDAGDVYRV